MQQKATAWVFALGEGCATHVVITTQQPGEDQATFCRRHSQAVKADAEEFQPKAGELPVAIDVDNNGDVTVTPQR